MNLQPIAPPFFNEYHFEQNIEYDHSGDGNHRGKKLFLQNYTRTGTLKTDRTKIIPLRVQICKNTYR